MARRRRAPESAYERRIRRYLEAHPGATRQEARGHRPPKGRSEYRERIARAERKRPGISRSAAAGHPSAEERRAARFFDRLRGEGPDTLVMFVGLDRQADGTWRRAGIDVFPADGDAYSIELSARNLPRLRELQAVLSSIGVAPIGAKYLQRMLAWVGEDDDDVDLDDYDIEDEAA